MALAQETRLSVFRLLVQTGEAGLPAGQIAKALAIPNATLSFHLKELANAGLVRSRQESRFLYYRADFQAMGALLAYLTENCCAGQPCVPAVANAGTACCPPLIPNPRRNRDETPTPLRQTASHAGGTHGSPPMSGRIYNVLFLCTGNSARSVLAEGLLNKLGAGRFRAFSAGSRPTGTVNPFALERLQKEHIPTAGLRSKSWDEFAQPDAPALDFIITVCDSAAGEVCPVWPGRPLTAHWGVFDPAAAEGTDDEKRLAFAKVFAILERRISLFASLNPDSLERLALEQQVRAIGQEGAS
jgi:arsenate reductase